MQSCLKKKIHGLYFLNSYLQINKNNSIVSALILYDPQESEADEHSLWGPSSALALLAFQSLGLHLCLLHLNFTNPGNSLAVQWLGIHASTAGRLGSIPGWATKILYAISNFTQQWFSTGGVLGGHTNLRMLLEFREEEPGMCGIVCVVQTICSK